MLERLLNHLSRRQKQTNFVVIGALRAKVPQQAVKALKAVFMDPDRG